MSLAEKGVKEIILIAQDTSKYGIDIYGERKLHELIGRISEIDGIRWVRVHYLYPEDIYDDLINEFKDNKKLLKYFDIPFQHISDNNFKKNEQEDRQGPNHISYTKNSKGSNGCGYTDILDNGFSR